MVDKKSYLREVTTTKFRFQHAYLSQLFVATMLIIFPSPSHENIIAVWDERLKNLLHSSMAVATVVIRMSVGMEVLVIWVDAEITW